MSFQGRNICFFVIDKFTIRPVRDAGPLAIVPKKSIVRTGNGSLAFRVIGATAPPVAGHPGFFQVVVSLGGHRPAVTVRAYFPIDIEVVE